MSENTDSNTNLQPTQQNQHRPWYTSSTFWTATATLLIAAFTAALVWVACQQQAIMQRQLRNAENADRAFVHFRRVFVSRIPKIAPKRVAISVNVFNAGNTTARHVRINAKCLTIGPDNKEIKARVDNWFKSTTARITFVFAPKQQAIVPACEFSEMQISKIVSGNKSGIIVLVVQYLDVFNNEYIHRTEQTRQLLTDNDFLPSGDYRLSFITNHNCSDEDCPK